MNFDLDYIPDPIEQMDKRIDKMCDEIFDCASDIDDELPCCECKVSFPISHLWPAYNSPDAPCICENCLDINMPGWSEGL